MELLTDTVVFNGPCVKVLNPLTYKSARKVKAELISQVDYLVVRDTVTGKERIEKGPQLRYLGPYETVQRRGCAITMTKTQYVIVENQLTGDKAIVKGPAVWFPSDPYEQASSTKSAIALQEDEYVRLKDEATGQRMIQKGKALLFLEPTVVTEGSVQKAWVLKAFEYVRLQDRVTGKISVHRGEKIVFPGPDDMLMGSGKEAAIDLQVDEFVKIEDQVTGEIRVEKGIGRVFLGPTEQVLHGGKKKAVQVDLEHAVLVRDLSTGQLRLVTEKSLFVPGPNETIEEVRPLIRLADHEAVVVKDQEGKLAVHYGSPEKQTAENPRSFFLKPYSEIVEVWWSSGLRRLKRDLRIERFDTRPQYMWHEFDVRTSDNVELVLECTMFWESMDLEKLVRTTGNLPGDMFNQCRSQFIKKVARVTLKKFMEELHAVSGAIFSEDQEFYKVRGIKVHSLEVTRYKCSDPRTSEVLQQIIEETTNRLNRLSQAESENEVNIFRMQGQIEQQKLNGSLLEIQQEHNKSEARVSGAAEAERIAAFVAGLAKDVPKLEDRIEMWKVLRKTDALSVVSGGGGSLYYTPKDVDLSIHTEKA